MVLCHSKPFHRLIHKFVILKKLSYICCLAWLICTSFVYAHKPNVPDNIWSQKIKLIENKGQWPATVLFRAAIPGGYVFATRTGLVYSLYDEKAVHDFTHGKNRNPMIKGHVYKADFTQANPNPTVRKENPSTEYYNFFQGSKPAQWAAHCLAYEKVTLENLYQGIDMELIAKSDYLKVNFIVKPFANPNQIKINYTGADGIELRNGALEVKTSVALIKEEKPICYQFIDGEQIPVESAYDLSKQSVAYSIGNYVHNKTLIIDPNIIFGTFSGSVADNFGFTATFDNDGNGYAGGAVYSTGFPTTTGAYQTNFAGGNNTFGPARDIGILKFSSDGKNLLYCTYLGGSGNEQPHSLICNSNNELYIMGTTGSADYPTTAGVFDQSYNQGIDIVISRLSSNGQSLQASTYIGGSADDGINGSLGAFDYNAINFPLAYNYGDNYRGEIIIDTLTGSIYVATSTRSSVANGFPIVNGFQTTFGGAQDACVLKFNAALSNLDFSTYLGGTGHDAGFGIGLDIFKNIYVCGGSTSAAIGPASGPYAHHGGVDAYIARIAANGSSLMKLLFIGTSNYDQAYFVQGDSKGNVYITGQTQSNTFPVKGNVYNAPGGKQFITTFNRNLDSIILSSTFGTAGTQGPNISPSAFLVDICNRVYVSGWGGLANQNFNQITGTTTGLPTTTNAIQRNTDGSDFYLIVFSPDIKNISYATFIGGMLGSGDHVDGGTSRFDKKSVVYQSVCAGCGGFSDFPTTNGAWSNINKGVRPYDPTQGGCNNALIKINLNVSEFAPIVKDTLLKITATDTLVYSFTITDPDGDSVIASYNSNLFSKPVNPATITFTRTVNTINAQLRWRTLCNDFSTDTLVIDIEARDNGCPDFRTTLAKIKVLVSPVPAVPSPFPECLKPLNDSTLELKWSAPAAATKYLRKYSIFKSTNGLSPIEIDSFWPPKNNLTDNKAKNHLLNNYCYFITYSNICRPHIDTSRTVCSLFKEDTARVPGFYLSKDTVIEIIAGDTAHISYTITDTDSKDSVFAQLSGPLLSNNRLFKLSKTDSLSRASVRFSYYANCNDVLNNDLVMNVYVQDNQCPQPRNILGKIRLKVIVPPAGLPPVLPCVRRLSSNSIQVRWKATSVNKYFSHFVLIRKNPNGSFKELAKVFNAADFTYTDNDAPDNLNSNYCYAAFAINSCQLPGDTGEWACTIRKPEDYPEAVSFYTVTVEQNRHIGVFWKPSTDGSFTLYNLYKKNNEPNAIYALISSFNNKADSIYLDQNVEVQKRSYCYTVKQVNDCGLETLLGKEACTILLKGISRPFEHSLQWSPYSHWAAGVKEYDILKEEPGQSPVRIGATAEKLTNYSDDKLNTDNGLYYYTVDAIEGNTGNGYTSRSNTIELIQSPLLYVPNAFTPNNDGLNEELNIRPVFVKDYDLKIYDRWGKLIFSTNNKYETYKDIYNNDPATSDVFVYLVTYTGWDGSSYTKRGNFTTIK